MQCVFSIAFACVCQAKLGDTDGVQNDAGFLEANVVQADSEVELSNLPVSLKIAR